MKFRQVHLDFHTSEQIGGIGRDFSREAFCEALKAGHVNSVTIFSKCHHGWSYHPTAVNRMHPHLNFDLFGEELRAARSVGVGVVGYISAGLDEQYAVEHGECLARDKDERIIRTPDFRVPGYHRICMNSPYLDKLTAEVRELCVNYEIDGVFLDIIAPIRCYCRNCVRRMRELGLDPMNEADVNRMAQITYFDYTERIRKTVDEVRPGLPVFHNGGATPCGRRDLIDTNSHIEIESLPTGGWGYDNLPMTSRYVQPLGKEFLGMTGKFHLSWGEFGGYKHENALIYETGLAVANGGKCSIGDQLHPLGAPDPETYRLIGKAYERIEREEPWLDGVRGVADVAILSAKGWYAARQDAAENATCSPKRSDVGAMRILLEGHYLFDVIDEESPFENYRVLILPDCVRVDEKLRVRLEAYLRAGGKLIASGTSGLSAGDGKPDFLPDLGARYLGTQPFEPNYLHVGKELPEIRPAGYVFYEKTETVEATGRKLAGIRPPYFERTAEHFCSHFHAPESETESGAGVCEGKDGIYIAPAVFGEYANVGSHIAKDLVTAALNRLIGKRTLEVGLPAQGIATLMDQYGKSRYVLHLLYAPRAAKGEKKIEVIEDCVPLFRVPVTLNPRGVSVRSVRAVPSGEEIPFCREADGSVRFEVPEVRIHTMVEIDYDPLKK